MRYRSRARLCIHWGDVRASDLAYETLRDDIIHWTLAPGKVLAEVELSERLGVSRTPVREAIARLVADGLATQQGARATTVSDVSLPEVRHMFELRRLLETAIARAAASADQMHREPFVELAEAFENAARRHTLEPEPYYQLVSQLDDRLDHAGQNSYITAAVKNLRIHLQRVRLMAQDDPDRLRASASEHAEIARAVANGDPDVAQAATTLHLHHALQHILDHALTPAFNAAIAADHERTCDRTS